MSVASSLITDGVMRQRSLNRKTKECERSSGTNCDKAEKKIQIGNTESAQSQHTIRFHLSRRILLALLILAVLSTALYFSNHWFSTTFIDRSDNLSTQSLDRTLHPEEHVNRSAITINLRWFVSVGFRSPDGVKRRVYLINGEFLGPTIEARSGDVLNVEVINNVFDEGLAIHWHGLYMRGSNEMDGAVGMTQDAIPPGRNFTYHFQIAEEQAGTFWYHAHNQVQRGDGLFGALIVHRPAERKTNRMSYDEERLLLVNDWYHRPADQALSWYMRAGSFGMEPVPDSILINGIGTYNCSKAVPARPIECSSTQVQPVMHMDVGKTYRFRIINAGILAGFSLKMNEAEMTVFEIDGGTEVDSPATGFVGVLYPGERLDAVVRLTSVIKQSLTVSLDREGFRYSNQALTSENDIPLILSGRFPAGERSTTSFVAEFDLQHLQSHHTHEMPAKPDMTMVLYTTTLKLARLSNVPHGFINHTSWTPQSPPLIDLSRSEYDLYQLVPFITYKKSQPLWVDIVLNNLDDDNHPFHLHGYSPYILQSYASGSRFGSWNPFVSTEPPGGALNLANPVSRDTFIVPRKGYVVLRFRADNPGLWLFHCHVLWHLGSGMAMGIEVGNV
jgi:FtsP/CotA-like multicopper oxidase with cupredoxin domain